MQRDGTNDAVYLVRLPVTDERLAFSWCNHSWI